MTHGAQSVRPSVYRPQSLPGGPPVRPLNEFSSYGPHPRPWSEVDPTRLADDTRADRTSSPSPSRPPIRRSVRPESVRSLRLTPSTGSKVNGGFRSHRRETDRAETRTKRADTLPVMTQHPVLQGKFDLSSPRVPPILRSSRFCPSRSGRGGRRVGGGRGGGRRRVVWGRRWELCGDGGGSRRTRTWKSRRSSRTSVCGLCGTDCPS